nr:DUF397 domain-containing protein [Streptomyces sp. NRRL F-5126]
MSRLLRASGSYSGGDGGACLEVADGVPGFVPVRDSKRADGSNPVGTAGAEPEAGQPGNHGRIDAGGWGAARLSRWNAR